MQFDNNYSFNVNGRSTVYLLTDLLTLASYDMINLFHKEKSKSNREVNNMDIIFGCLKDDEEFKIL